jgi:kanamycin kinase
MVTNDPDALPIPAELRDEYASWTWTAVSAYPGRSATWRLSNEAGTTRFLKVVRRGWTPSVDAEVERTVWAGAYLPVPQVLRSGDTKQASWMISEGMAGLDATHQSFRHDVPRLVTRLAEGLRRFHSAPVHACPFSFRLDDAIHHVQRRQETNQVDPDRDFHAEFSHLTVERAVEELIRTRPDSEDLVVCHGDYCVPNILLSEKAIIGFVDLGELGVADRWWDLAVATWSLAWNFGPGYEARFLAAYGVSPDAERIRYYRLLYDLAS